MLSSFIAALRFLTILPLPGQMGSDAESLTRSLPFFPVVGLLIGGAGAMLAIGLGELFPMPVTAVFIVIVLLLASGGLHMDGLSDTADGFFSSRPKERMLEIMRDSHVGAMGVMAIVLTLVLKIAALSAYSKENIWMPALLMPLAGRCVLVVLTATMPYARAEGGLATPFYSGSSKIAAAWAVAFFTAIAWWLAGPAGLITVIGVMMTTLFFAIFCLKKIDGATGDTLGAACELAETVTVLLLIPQPIYRLLGGIS